MSDETMFGIAAHTCGPTLPSPALPRSPGTPGSPRDPGWPWERNKTKQNNLHHPEFGKESVLAQKV